MRWTIPNGVIRRQIFVSLLSINLQLGLVGKLRFGLRRGRRREGGESLEGGLGGEVMGLLGRAGPAAVVRRVVHFAVDGYGGAEPQQVGRALAPVGVVRRRPPPLLAQLVQLRLEHCRGGLGTNGPLPIGDSFGAIARSDPLSRLLRLSLSNLSSLFLPVGSPLFSQAKTPISSFPVSVSLPSPPTQSAHPSTSCPRRRFPNVSARIRVFLARISVDPSNLRNSLAAFSAAYGTLYLQ